MVEWIKDWQGTWTYHSIFISPSHCISWKFSNVYCNQCHSVFIWLHFKPADQTSFFFYFSRNVFSIFVTIYIYIFFFPPRVVSINSAGFSLTLNSTLSHCWVYFFFIASIFFSRFIYSVLLFLTWQSFFIFSTSVTENEEHIPPFIKCTSVCER